MELWTDLTVVVSYVYIAIYICVYHVVYIVRMCIYICVCVCVYVHCSKIYLLHMNVYSLEYKYMIFTYIHVCMLRDNVSMCF